MGAESVTRTAKIAFGRFLYLLLLRSPKTCSLCRLPVQCLFPSYSLAQQAGPTPPRAISAKLTAERRVSQMQHARNRDYIQPDFFFFL